MKRAPVLALLLAAGTLTLWTQPLRVDAQQALPESRHYLEIQVAEAFGSGSSAGAGCVVPEDVAALDATYGTAYIFDAGHPGFLQRTASYIARPSETAAMQEFFAFGVDELSAAEWADVAQAGGTDPDAKLSLIYKADNNYLGVPIEWNATNASVIAAFLEAGDQGNATGNPALNVYAAHLLAQSLEETATLKEQAGAAVDPDAATINALRAIDCQTAGDASAGQFFVGMTHNPDQFQGLEVRMVTTASGFYGERLGVDYSSWPHSEQQMQ